MTEMQLTLSVLDQSPVRCDGTAADALRESVELAKAAERLGYARYWVAEHHNSAGFAGTSPEILIGQIAANTKSIRVGSGGVMLTHYSSLKVAEQFRVLSAFYPDRIDLGIGRAPGSDQRTLAALAFPKQPVDVQHFPRQVVDLVNYLNGVVEEEHPYAKIRPQPGPTPEDKPEVWLLGSSDYSARVAAVLGLPFAFADFFGTTSDVGPAVAELYRREFQPSAHLSEPKLNVTVQVVCAETEERARFIGSSRNLSKLSAVTRKRVGLLPPEEASQYQPNDEERQALEGFTKGYLDGTPEQVRDKVWAAAERYGTTDVSIVTNAYHFEDRLRSYELVAEVFGLTPRTCV
ncbi:MAG TPA: LLM class flavin-dependent oxidoreductase [Chloroflexota bacterium]|nr:LLM class flavin-dependent oxidoreductase [Chloroflexota bacterium]